MLNSTAIDVALGLIFFYVIMSLVVSAVQEWIASAFKLRSKNLKKGIERLVSAPIAQQVYNHPMIKNLALNDDRLPSYIDAKTLSAVLLDLVARNDQGQTVVTQTADEIKQTIAKIPADNPIGAVLKTAVVQGENAANEVTDYLAGWFDQGMDRISGWYKRDAKVITLAIAVLVTLALNANTVRIAQELWTNEALRSQIAAQAEIAAKNAEAPVVDAKLFDTLKQFPIGWQKQGPPAPGVSPGASPGASPDNDSNWLMNCLMNAGVSLIGWLLTIAAISLGAPFWFDLLGKVANLKGAGRRPKPATGAGNG